MSRLDNNLHSLSRHHPEVYTLVKKSAVSQRIRFETSRKGPLTAKVQTEKGEIWLHSKFDPEKEARRFIETNDVSKTGMVLVYGFACGHHINVLMETLHKKAQAVVLEPDIELFRSVLEQNDFSSLFADERLTIIVGSSAETIFHTLEKKIVKFFLSAKIITHESSQRINKSLYYKISKTVKDFIDYGTTSLYTASSIAPHSKFNAFMNMPYAVFNPGIEHLKDKAKGSAAVVIGAGPSLAKNIHLLKDAPIIKIATGTILKRLLSEGITPHAVCHIDYHFKLTKKYFQDLPPLDNTLLVLDTRASYKTADMYTGPVATWDDHFTEKYLKTFRKQAHGTLPPGATVSQTCYFLAKYLGCDPIIFVGQDLAYPGHITHAPGTAIQDNWWTETNRFVSMENKEWEYFARVRKSFYQVDAIGGGKIYTDRQMFTYLQSFKHDFLSSSIRIIDACEMGAFKEGAEHMSLQEALQQAFIPINASFSLLSKEEYKNTARRNEILKLFDTYIQQADETLTFYNDALEILHKMLEHFDDEKLFKELLHQVDTVKSQFDKYRTLTTMINELTQSDDYRKQKDDLEIVLGNYEGRELQKKHIERDTRFLQGLRGGLLYFREFMINSRKRLEIFPKTSREDIIEDLDIINTKVIHENS